MSCRGGVSATVAVATVALAGCGSAVSSQPAAAPVTHCAIYAYGHDARAFVSGSGADAFCAKMIRTYAASGTLFDYTPTAPQEGGFGTVCTLASGGLTVTVDDDGGQNIGQQVCTSLVSAGWTQSTPAPAAAQSGKALPGGVAHAIAGQAGLPSGLRLPPGSYFVNCSVAQCTSLAGAGPFGTTCGPVVGGRQLCKR